MPGMNFPKNFANLLMMSHCHLIFLSSVHHYHHFHYALLQTRGVHGDAILVPSPQTSYPSPPILTLILIHPRPSLQKFRSIPTHPCIFFVGEPKAVIMEVAVVAIVLLTTSYYYSCLCGLSDESSVKTEKPHSTLQLQLLILNC